MNIEFVAPTISISEHSTLKWPEYMAYRLSAFQIKPEDVIRENVKVVHSCLPYDNVDFLNCLSIPGWRELALSHQCDNCSGFSSTSKSIRYPHRTTSTCPADYIEELIDVYNQLVGKYYLKNIILFTYKESAYIDICCSCGRIQLSCIFDKAKSIKPMEVAKSISYIYNGLYVQKNFKVKEERRLQYLLWKVKDSDSLYPLLFMPKEVTYDNGNKIGHYEIFIPGEEGSVIFHHQTDVETLIETVSNWSVYLNDRDINGNRKAIENIMRVGKINNVAVRQPTYLVSRQDHNYFYPCEGFLTDRKNLVRHLAIWCFHEEIHDYIAEIDGLL